jgi:hypothetical protein
MSGPIHLHDTGQAVSDHQRHLNDRLHEISETPVDIDGDCGPQTILKTGVAVWYLGGLETTIANIHAGAIDEGVQTMVAEPGGLNAQQQQRAHARRGKPFLESIILVDEWGAAPPTQQPARVGKPDKIIFHHTAGHHPNLDQDGGESRAEAFAYAKAIQRDHMHRNPPLIDTGQNFLVTRSGLVLEGRHGSVAAIMDGAMVDSAHCPGENHNPGIEHEHIGDEPLTAAQRQASLFIHAFICHHTGISPTEVHGHREFFATDCPGALAASLPQFRLDLAHHLAA